MAVSELSARTGIDAWARAAVRSLFSHWTFVVLIAMVSLYYLFLLSNGTFRPFAPEMLDKVFDNMLIHLLHGDFTVDRDAIGFEAFTRDGRTYTYFGIFPALLRLAGLPFFDVAKAHLARFSCWAAVVAYVALQTRMLLTVHRSLQPQERLRGFLGIMVAATVLSGPQLYILGSAWVYHEPIVWSAAIGAGFNLVVVRAAFGGGGLRTRDLLSLAILAGLALSTRVTVGMGLYVGSILLVAWTAWERHAGSRINQLSRGDAGGGPRRIGAVAGDAGVILPIAILILFAVSLGAINFARWGNPLTFADFRYYDFSNLHRQSDFEVIHNYGEISIGRIWIGALYYATGIPYVLKSVPPFADFLGARVVTIEAPPVMPLLTNPITVLLAAVGVCRLWWKPDLPAGSINLLRLTLLGHVVPVIIVFGFFYFALRYRLDFAPFMTLASLVGYRSVCIAGLGAQRRRERWLVTGLALLLVGVAFSHYTLLMHKAWSMAVPMEVRRALGPFLPSAYLPVASPPL